MLSDTAISKVAAKPGFAGRVQPADLPELMDEPCSYEDFRACLRDLAKVNRLTQAYKPTLAFLDRVVARKTGGEPLRVLDVGSGGGDMLRQVVAWAAERGVDVEVMGIDLNPHSERAAKEFGDASAANIRWMTGDVFEYAPVERPDVVLSALFTHHLSSADVVRFLRWMEEYARVGWFINDLERSERAARWFRVLPIIFRWHRFVRHDGPVSLRRAFRKDDWLRLLANAGIPSGEASIEPHPMARLCVARMR